MIVDLRNTYENEEQYIKGTIFCLISLFGYMKYTEIVDFFPTIDEKRISKYINEALQSMQLIKKKMPKHYSLYTTKSQTKNGNGFKKRYKYYEIMCFIRHLLNSKDNDGYLINNISCIGTDKFPFDIFIVCNNTYYEIAHCIKDNISMYDQVLTRIDEEADERIKKEKEKLQNTNIDTSVLYSDDPNRIIIVDNVDDFDYIRFRKVKYIVCKKDEKDFLFK